MDIKLIVGLGNPGSQYEHTRHNAGFWFLDELAHAWGVSFQSQKKYHGQAARAERPQGDIWLLKPDTFMNLSGQAVAPLAQFYKIRPDQILVAHDELDIPCGQTRFKIGGGNGGHNGLKDIQARLGTPDFYRLRLGIGHPGERNLVTSFVLGKPPAAERELIERAVAKSLAAIPLILEGSRDEAVRFLHGKQPGFD